MDRLQRVKLLDLTTELKLVRQTNIKLSRALMIYLSSGNLNYCNYITRPCNPSASSLSTLTLLPHLDPQSASSLSTLQEQVCPSTLCPSTLVFLSQYALLSVTVLSSFCHSTLCPSTLVFLSQYEADYTILGKHKIAIELCSVPCLWRVMYTELTRCEAKASSIFKYYNFLRKAAKFRNSVFDLYF